jgi:serine protease Do
MTAFSTAWRQWMRAGTLGLALALSVPAAGAQQLLAQLPSLADEAEKLLPAVVDISTSQKVAQGPGMQLPDLPPNSPFKEFFDDFLNRQRRGENGQPQQQQRSVTSLGSGFVIDASGIVITNNHVVEGADQIDVNFTDGTSLKAELVGRDPKVDLAVLRVKTDRPLPAVSFGDSDKLRIGDWVLAIGNPFGLGGSVSLGIVSARGRDINAGPYDDFIQTDAAINKGNSGGPLFNLNGEVVGINTAIYSPSGGSVGIGFSVPANTARGVIDQLIKFGETRRGWLGVRIQQVTPDLVEGLGLDKPRGALIADVTPDGPAAKAGVMAGDVVVEFNSRVIREMKDLPRIVADTPIGEKVPLKVMRKGKEVALSAEVGRLEDGEKQVAATGPVPLTSSVDTLGMTLSPLNDQLRTQFNIDKNVNGAVVTAIAPNGAASEKRLEPGDVITEAGEKEVKAPGDVEARVKDAERDKKNSILLLVAKGGKQGEMRFIALKLKKG